MAMIMSGLCLSRLRATGPSQRPFLGEDVARREFGRTGEGEILAHGGRRRCRRKPWAGQPARRVGSPGWNAAEPTLLSQIFGDGANQRIQPRIAGQFGLTLDQGIAIPVALCQIERVNPFGKDDILRRSGLNMLNRLSEGIWVHRSVPRDSYSAIEIAAFRKPPH